MPTVAASRGSIEHSSLYNPDLAPATSERRTWGTYNYAALWVSMSVNILTYMLAASLIQGGMDWKQAVLTVFLGNSIVLVPMLLNSHPGAKYGIPFPVLARASFGVLGANIAAVLRALVACGWFGIQSWIGGEAINTLLATLWPGWTRNPHGVAICFMIFWAINLLVVLKGIEYIRFLQGISAPILLGVGLLLLGWAYTSAGGFGPMLSARSKFQNTSEFLKFLIPALNGTVGFWSTVSLNIPDFTRFANNQRGQMIGQAVALPTTMTLYSFIGVAVTSATVVIYGTAIWDPVQLLSRFHSPVAVVISLLAILLATVNVNIGANVVSPANDFSNLWPRKISFKLGGAITCFMGIAMMPWKLLANHRTFIFGWLGGYAAVLGPVAGIMICDYFIVRRRVLLVNDLYLRHSAYEYSAGFNWRAIAALLIGTGVALIGLLVPPLRFLYDYSWFVGFAVAFFIYLAIAARPVLNAPMQEA
ncbi:MAG: NCS1 family nucleobase:cation symporter-1 [Acidobacteria bacterium]|nr:NCS1 family nucleobase:cation symporter-1 [Acidobacteriota bacterium]MBV9147647.1 NCS1 family nucleobase:cation symporter-1 [Acidobacteriota bacterium]